MCQIRKKSIFCAFFPLFTGKLRKTGYWWSGGESDDDAAANTTAATAVTDDDGFVLDNEAEYNNYCSLSNVNQATDGCVCYIV